MAKCPECPPPGAPGWMTTFSDLVTLLLTFFILLYALSKQDVEKFKAVAGSIRKAFAGNALKVGETITQGKSPDDSPTMLESQEPVEPYPIDLLTTEGFLDKHEINRESEEDLKEMKQDIQSYELDTSVDTVREAEGIKMRIKDKIYFKTGSTSIDSISMDVFKRIIKLMQTGEWVIFIEGFAEVGETSSDGKQDAYGLSSLRSQAVMKSLIQRGVRPEKISSVFYGDSRSDGKTNDKRVEFILRKRDLRADGQRAK